MNRTAFKIAKNMVRFILLLFFLFLLFFFYDKEHMSEAFKQILSHPVMIVVIVGIYCLSFFLKGVAWKLYLNEGVRISSCMIGLFYSLLFNHLLPLKVGDGLRVMVMNQREKQISVEQSFHSVFVLRVLDTLALMVLVILGLPFFPFPLELPGIVPVALVGIAIMTAGVILVAAFPDFLMRQYHMLKDALSGARGLLVIGLVSISWMMEGAILFGVAAIIGAPLPLETSIWINSVTIIGQLFQFAPGGLGTYESVMSFTLLSVGVPLSEGLSMAIISHGLKFIFSFIVGGIVIVRSPVSFENMKRWVKLKG
ncbi:flippase-like domain-containing protein [Rossellomorea aquimaris]|uniref:lysylphosphatidylglycerol synthase transmembrane domain-containing protein n=1 Tax=Rossellomorea aquimaris TaxID=189382 RepID=UPI001CD6AF24|nr:lysylphosphatidylglycerol synthase transmembrane domain-containing protein [Rossellomorea aquimaris]MCA1056374.1 flippase-like domain-containing protein [Rossellomorea aquimaris]